MKIALQEEKNRKAHMHMLADNALELSVIIRMSTQHCDQVLENLLVQTFKCGREFWEKANCKAKCWS